MYTCKIDSWNWSLCVCILFSFYYYSFLQLKCPAYIGFFESVSAIFPFLVNVKKPFENGHSQFLFISKIQHIHVMYSTFCDQMWVEHFRFFFYFYIYFCYRCFDHRGNICSMHMHMSCLCNNENTHTCLHSDIYSLRLNISFYILCDFFFQ